jgi:protein-S-isoprenylcysteine O-methyltransferase Ste14
MREAAAPALLAVCSIARISWRVDIVPGSSLVSPVNLTDSGKARVNREAACSGKRPRKSSADEDRSELLTCPTMRLIACEKTQMPAGAGTLDKQGWIRSALGVLVLAMLLFAPAGTLRFWQGWLFGFVFVAATSAISIYFLKHDPKLVKRRMRAGPTAEQESTQKIIVSIIFLGFLLLMALPGLDQRLHWSAVPTWLEIAANAGVALSFWVFFIVMRQNSFAASTIQVEPDQPVVSTGVYAIVRHPLYSGALLLLACIPLALGSYWTLIVAIAMVPALVWRILDEERFLKQNLPGYIDYCRRVRYRLIPNIW